MKKILTSLIDATFFVVMGLAWLAAAMAVTLFFTLPASAEESKLLDPTNDPWDSVLQVRVVEVDEWGCQLQAGWSQQYFVYVERYVCPQYMDEFYARMSSAQRRKALEEGIKLLNPGFREKYPDLWEEVALNKFFRTITENGQG